MSLHIQKLKLTSKLTHQVKKQKSRDHDIRIAKPIRETLTCDSCWNLEKIINKNQPNTATDLRSGVHLGICQFISQVNNLPGSCGKENKKG